MNMLQEIRISTLLSSFGIPLKNINYTPLIGGLSTACLYRFEYNKHTYVVRLLPSHLDPATCSHHISITSMAGSLGIGPKVHFADENTQAIIMDCIAGKSSCYADLQDPSNMRECAKLIAYLHHSPTYFPTARSPFTRFFEFLDKARQQKSVYWSELTTIKDTMAELEKIFATLAIKSVPCHLDLHPLNILMTDKRPFFVDWVNGGMSNPYFDLATFAQFHCLDYHATITFLTHYFGHPPTECELQYFALAKPIRLFVIAAAYLCTVSHKNSHFDNANTPSISFSSFIEQQLAGPLDISYEQIGLIMLNAGLDLIKEQVFKNSLNVRVNR